MELSGSFFEYSGRSSREYNLVFGHVNTNRFSSLTGDISSITVFDRRSKKNMFIGEDFSSSAISFEAEVVTEDGSPIATRIRREIEKWLFHKQGYAKLYVDLDCDTELETYELVDGVQKRLYLNCRMINAESVEGNGGIVGYKFTIECDSAMAWQDSVVYEFSLDHTSQESNSTITVPVDSDLNDYIYPKVTITTGSSGGDINIINYTDSLTRQTSFTGLSPNVSFVMYGDGVNYISGNNYLKFTNRNFIRLLDGDNELNIVGDISKLTFEFSNRRYL